MRVQAIRRFDLRLIASAIAVLIATVQPVKAAGTIACETTESEPSAKVDIVVGQLPALIPISVRVGVGERIWATSEGEAGEAVKILQAFDDGRILMIDLADENVETVLFSIRLVRAAEGRDLAHVGTLIATGIGAYALICVGP